jgi:hypothetical protein
MMTTGFPAIGALLGLWIGWFVLGGILHLALTLLGSRTTTVSAFNMAAWASIPFAIRMIVQIIAMLTTHKLIVSPGLSGFMAADGTGALMFARIVLSMVDLYLIWQTILLILGAVSLPGLSRRKAVTGVIGIMILMLVLSAIPGFIAAQLGGLDVTRSFFYF